jgi:hypothetical protein
MLPNSGMANLNPSPTTRWQPGQSGNAGRTGPRRRTILVRVPVVRSLEEVKSKEGAWRGSMRELIEAAARDPDNDLGVRLAAAAQLLRHELDTPPPRAKVDLSLLDAGEQTTLWTLLKKVLPKNPQLAEMSACKSCRSAPARSTEKHR